MIQRILDLAKENGLNQSDLANIIGCSTGNISDWKKGRVKPSINVYIKVADHFHVSVDYLTGRSEIRNTDFMIDVYNTGVIRWLNDRAFKEDQKAALKDNFLEILIRYKEIVNKYANYMYSDERKRLIKDNADLEQLSLGTCETINRQLRDMVLWIAAFPSEADKFADSENVNLQDLNSRLASMIGVFYDEIGYNLTEDETDLLSIWSMLDKEGKRILLGTAFSQKQRVETEKKIPNNETA